MLGALRLDSLGKVSSQAFDLMILRPLWGSALIVGSALFAPAALLSAPGGRRAFDDAKEVFIDGPYEKTFVRPLGEF